MAYVFPSADWTQAYKDAVNNNSEYRKAAQSWTHGTVAMVVTAEPSLGIATNVALLLDVHEGVCRGSDYFSDAEQAIDKANFVIEANYARWKEVVQGKLEPIKAMMQGKLKLSKGSLPTMIRYVDASRELVESAANVPTEFVG